MWTTYPGTLRPFDSFLIPLNLEKDLQPAQLVTIKLTNKASRGWTNQEPLISNPNACLSLFCCFPVWLEKSSAVASWQSSFYLLFMLIKISDLLSMEAVQTCASTSNKISE